MAYYSPEAMLRMQHDKKTDVWSVGMYFATLLIGLEPISWDVIGSGEVHPIQVVEKVSS